MATLGKRTTQSAKASTARKLYAVEDAVKMVKDRAKAKFDETIEVAMKFLAVDPRHADQMVRGAVVHAQRHRQDGPRRMFAKGAKAPRPPRPAPTSSAATTSTTRSPPASWTSTRSSRPPT